MNDIAVNASQDTVIITPGFELDGLNSPKLLATLLPLGKRYRKLAIDLSKVECITSAGLRAILEARRTIEDDRQIVICTSDPSILSLLRMTGLNRLIDISPTLNSLNR